MLGERDRKEHVSSRIASSDDSVIKEPSAFFIWIKKNIEMVKGKATAQAMLGVKAGKKPACMIKFNENALEE